MKKILLVLFAFSVTTSAFAMPLSSSNLYLDGFSGFNFVCEGNIKVNNGFAVGGALGYRLNRFRFEGELSYRRNTLDRQTVGEYFYVSDGRIESLALLGNAMLDLPLFSDFVVPYIGVGAGYHWANDRFSLKSIPRFEGDYALYLLRSSSHSLAYQGIAGISVGVGLKIQGSCEYRYLHDFHIARHHTLALNLKRYF